MQNAVQGWYFSKEQCTLHPIVVYYKNSEGKLANINLAFMSDDLTHNTCFLYDLQNLLSPHISVVLPSVESIEYFSDDCAGQYKNKNLLNLTTYHQQDSKINANWNFCHQPW